MKNGLPPGTKPDLPRVISRGTVLIGPVEVEIVQLDDGARLVTQESAEKLIEWLRGEPGPDAPE